MDFEARSAKATAQHAEATPAERYVAFQYEQMKDLTKHFLTLIAGTLVLTLSVADKLIVSVGNASTAPDIAHALSMGKLFLGSAWITLVVAFVFAGGGLAGVFFAAVAAREGKIYGKPANYTSWSRPSYLCIDFAGVLYVAGLALLVIAGLYRLQVS